MRLERLSRARVVPLLQSALHEDRAADDVTSHLLYPPDARLAARLVMREQGVLCGINVARWVFQLMDRRVQLRTLCRDGAPVRRGMVVAEVSGPARAILSAERTAANVLGLLSGIATLTSRYVREARGTPSKIFDTRKTAPGLRLLERYAVRCGGGVNHRPDLRSQILVKSNHLRGLAGCGGSGGITRLLETTRRRAPPGCRIEIEVEDERLVPAALAARPDIIMLDNLPLAAVRRAVRFVRRSSRPPLLEVSGGVTLENVRAFAQTGVERIAIGALTHSARWLDVALEVERRQTHSG